MAVKELERNHLRSLEVASAPAAPGAGATSTSASASAALPLVLADVRLIREQVDRCRAILERMSSEAGEGSGENWAPLAVPELVRTALLGLPAGVAIRPELSPAVMQGRLRVPQRAVAQALRGLVKNAQEATGAGGGAVRLRVDAAADGVVFAVEDQGTGIPAGNLERLGEPFFTTKPAGTGMGLGVFLARAVAERLGGSLRVDSTLGRGTVAVLTLPLEAPAAREPPP